VPGGVRLRAGDRVPVAVVRLGL